MGINEIANSHDIVPILAIVLFFGLAALWSMGLLIIGFVKAFRSGGSGKSGTLSADEARSFQELERGFRNMESRVESLETLLLETAKNEKTDSVYD